MRNRTLIKDNTYPLYKEYLSEICFQTGIFCIKKTPGYSWGAKKAYAMSSNFRHPLIR